MRGYIVTAISIMALSCSFAQERSLTEQLKIFSTSDSVRLDSLWRTLVSAHRIPLVVNDSVAFLYRGHAKSVAWMGDFNGWGYNRKMDTKGKNAPGTDLWIWKTSFPTDARLDYKIVLNDSEWILDPNNDHHQWSGVGGGSPNSELRMPNWKADPLTSAPVEGVHKGKLQRDLLINSKSLGYQVMYSLYLPDKYEPSHSYPILYVTDGYEYMHEQMGNMITVLDNLIFLKKMRPIIVVFLDHREPVDRSNNRRMQELAMNQKYLSFLTSELIPAIESKFPASQKREERGIIGTSMGGLTAAYFAFSKPDIFGLAGIQSPAFWFKPEVYTVCDNPQNPPVKTFMTTGLINDTAEGALKMKSLLDKNTCTYQYREVNQGHSWGNWRELLDDILIYFYPAVK